MSEKVIDECNPINWPEFKPFADRLGIDLTKWTKTLTIQLGEGMFPIITHEYVGSDNVAKLPEIGGAPFAGEVQIAPRKPKSRTMWGD